MSVGFVKKEVSRLSKDWFTDKSIFFSKEKFYLPDINRLAYSNTEDWWEEDEQGMFTYQPYDRTVDIGFEDYCWYWDEHDLYVHDENGNNYPDNSEDISILLYKWIDAIFEKINDNKTKFHILQSCVEELRETINDLKELFSNALYAGVLEDFFARFTVELRHKYTLIYYLNRFDGSSINPCLKFDLNQDQLAALLYILADAGFIHAPYPNDTTFIDFCEQHFLFKNQIAKRHTLASALRRKYSDAKKPSKARDFVINKLEEVFAALSKDQKRVK